MKTPCGTSPLVKKLGIKPGCRFVAVHEPDGFRAKLIDLPADAIEVGPEDEFDVSVLFVTEMKVLRKDFPKLKKRLVRNGGIWIAYPKKASGVTTDLTEASVREFGLDSGLVDNKNCAIDEVWSGLRFVYRLKDR